MQFPIVYLGDLELFCLYAILFRFVTGTFQQEITSNPTVSIFAYIKNVGFDVKSKTVCLTHQTVFWLSARNIMWPAITNFSSIRLLKLNNGEAIHLKTTGVCTIRLGITDNSCFRLPSFAEICHFSTVRTLFRKDIRPAISDTSWKNVILTVSARKPL